jgi:UDP-N-acetylmuramoylalanine--D-glutamate ligase
MSLKDAVKKIINNGYDRKIIIIGGKIDNLEIEESIDFIKYLRTFEVYLYGENKEILNDIIKNPKSVCNTLEEVINIININEKLVILFSPGAQSLDQYSSYIERGREFKYLINKKLNKLEVI